MTSAGNSITRVHVNSDGSCSSKVAKSYWKRGGLIVVASLTLLVISILALNSVGRGRIATWLSSASQSNEYYTIAPTTLNITLAESGELKPRRSVEIKCEVEGQTAILYLVPESTHVDKGDLLVELASDELEQRRRTQLMEVDRIKADYEAAVAELDIQRNQNESNIRAASINWEVARLDLEKYLNGDFIGRQKEINVNIQQSQMDIARKVTDLEENKQLETKGWVTSNFVKDLEFALDVARMQLERHELAKEILLTYEKPMIEKQRRSAVDKAEAALEDEKKRAASLENKSKARVEQFEKQLVNAREGLERIERQIENCKIYAPTDGVVQYPTEAGFRWGTMRLATGETVRKGQTLVILPDTSQMAVATRIHEADRHLVREDMQCLIRVPAVPGRAFTGRIVKIDKFADSENLWLNPELKEHGAEILLDQTDAPISPGDSAEITILIDRIENALAVPVQCVVTRGSTSYVFDESGEPVAVTIGRGTTSLLQIREGIREGQRIRMQIDDQLLAKLPTSTPLDIEAVLQLPAETTSVPDQPQQPTPTDTESAQVTRTSAFESVQEIGQMGKARERLYAISVERRVKHPARSHWWSTPTECSAART